MYVEEIFRKPLSKKEKKQYETALAKAKIINLLNRVKKEPFFIKTIINIVDAGNIVYNVADELGKKDVVVVLDWFGIHVMPLDQMITRLAKFISTLKKAELNYYTIQYLGVLIKDKQHYNEIMQYIADNLPKKLSENYQIAIKGTRKIIIQRKKEAN